jgi:hypothetical protein
MRSISGQDEDFVTALLEHDLRANAVGVCCEGEPGPARIKCGQAFSGSGSG